MDGSYPFYSTRRIWIFVLAMLIVLDCYFHVYVYYNVLQNPRRVKKYNANIIPILHPKNQTAYYKYPLVNGSELSMDYKIGYNSSYFWFKSMKHLFKDLSADESPKYPRNTDPILVKLTVPDLEWIEEQNPQVAVGGYYAPEDCKSAHRVAVIIPYRGRPLNLIILLSSLHQLLKKQLLEYRIFVIEQNGTEKFNKGTLYNIAFLETQRFGSWDCLIFHDVDLVPEDEGIPYSCPEQPTHMSAGNDSWGNSDVHRTIFGGVTALTPEQYEAVNGYSNLYWDWGVEDDDFYSRTMLLTGSGLRFRRDDLTSTKYNLFRVTREKLYTHILADVNPTNLRLDPKSLMQRLFDYKSRSSAGHRVFKSRSDPHK